MEEPKKISGWKKLHIVFTLTAFMLQCVGAYTVSGWAVKKAVRYFTAQVVAEVKASADQFPVTRQKSGQTLRTWGDWLEEQPGIAILCNDIGDEEDLRDYFGKKGYTFGPRATSHETGDRICFFGYKRPGADKTKDRSL